MKSRVRREPARARTAAAGSPWRGRSPQHIVFYILLAFLLVCLVGGGSNRADIASLLYLRPLNVVCLVAMLIVPTRWDFRCLRAPLILLGLLAAVVLIQLVPLPPSVWTALPGRAPFAEAAIALNGQPWRPISLTPDLTLSSLLALLVPLTVLVGFAGIRPDQRMALLPVAIGAAMFSAVLGIAQFAGGAGVNFYERHSLDVPNGVFANRNHHAAFLACALVLIATWLQSQSRRRRLHRYALAGLAAFLLLAVVVATGSRSGTVLTLLSLSYGAVITLGERSGRRRSRRPLVLQLGAVGAASLMIGFMLLAGRAVSLARLFGFDPAAEQRIRAFPTLIAMLRDFLPVGSGFGSFDPAFRMYEPDSLLHPGYFNHAHNDWLELALTGGVPALLLLGAFILWAAFRLYAGFRMPASAATLAARGGGIVLLVLAAASATDYPLRTPLLAALFALACAWLACAGGDKPRASRQH